jgi:hypothetical protein
MAPLEDEVNTLTQLMDQEIASYHLIIDELKEEAECLRTGAIDSLVKVVKRIEQYTETLRRLQKLIQASIGRIFEVLGKDLLERTLSHLAANLPPVHRMKMKFYQHTLTQLQDRVRPMNEKNKAFIREHLAFLGDLTSWLIHPVTETPCYPNRVHASPVVPLSYAFNREV